MKAKRYLKSLVAFIVTVMMLVAVSCKDDDKTQFTTISLDENVISLTLGTTQTLTATIDPPASTSDIVWTSSNPEVATVIDGKVTAVGEGKTTINAKIGNSTAFCDVIVAKGFVAVEGVTLNKPTLSLPIGGVEKLIASIIPADATNQRVTWSSSDEEIATVDENGTVTAFVPGEATIIVTTLDGGKTAECIVTVEAVPVESVTLNKTTLDLFVEDEDKLTAVVSPANATNKAVTWSSSNESIATVDEDGTVIGIAVGEAIITVTTEDGNKTATCTVTVKSQPVSLIIVKVNANVKNSELSNGDTHFKGTIGSGGIAFHGKAPEGVVIPATAAVLKFEYKLSADQILKEWARVYMYHREVPTAWGITEDYSVINDIAMPATEEWKTFEFDFTPVIDKLTDKSYNHDPSFFEGDMFQFRFNSWDNKDRVWEIKNIRLEERE